jgi:hypothetical protein
MYTVCPGAGPKFLFGSAFPYKTPDHIVPHVRFLPNVALNATPSGHLAWALLLLWVARRHCGKYCQYNCSVFVGFTILSTMGLGEHYLVDLILSVPFAAGMWALMQGRWPRTLGAFLAVVAWSCALRRGWALQLPLAAVWMACIATVAIPLCLIRGLQRRERTQVAVSVGMAAPA